MNFKKDLILIVLISIICSLNAVSQRVNTSHDRAIELLLEYKTITEREAVNMRVMHAKNMRLNEKGKKDNPDDYERISGLIERYKKEVVMPQIETMYSVRETNNMPTAQQFTIPVILIEILDGLTPWLIDTLFTKDIPKPLNIFKWLSMAKDRYRTDAEFRNYVDQQLK